MISRIIRWALTVALAAVAVWALVEAARPLAALVTGELAEARVAAVDAFNDGRLNTVTVRAVFHPAGGGVEVAKRSGVPAFLAPDVGAPITVAYHPDDIDSAEPVLFPLSAINLAIAAVFGSLSAFVATSWRKGTGWPRTSAAAWANAWLDRKAGDHTVD